MLKKILLSFYVAVCFFANSASAAEASKLNFSEIRINKVNIKVQSSDEPSNLLPRQATYVGHIPLKKETNLAPLKNAEIHLTNLAAKLNQSQKTLNESICREEAKRLFKGDFDLGFQISKSDILATKKGAACLIKISTLDKTSLLKEKYLLLVRTEGQVLGFIFKFQEPLSQDQVLLFQQFIDGMQVIHK